MNVNQIDSRGREVPNFSDSVLDNLDHSSVTECSQPPDTSIQKDDKSQTCVKKFPLQTHV